MTNILGFSQRASLGMHAMVRLAARPGEVLSTAGLARELSASREHLSKVMQRLTHAGLVRAQRGPTGGFRLARSAGRITLLNVYEAIEGPLEAGGCLYSAAVCGRRECIFGNLLSSVGHQVRQYLATTKLPQLAEEARS